MVMEAQPSPQCVGREFVRQYYTLLNEAPTHLHRFYNNQSSFVHGGMEMLNGNRETKPVIGQRQIHQRIQQLNFQDCHAKISQVDSQATLGNGVVVQVTGELSNNGQPMRRFTQTFVLAAQSPKKYYVHNDIFRYQDMLMSDEEGEGDSGRSEAEEEMEADNQPVAEMQPNDVSQQQSVYYNAGGQVVNGGPVPQSTAPIMDDARLPTAPPASSVPNYNMDLMSMHSPPAVSPVQQQPMQQPSQISHGGETYAAEAEEMSMEMAHEATEDVEPEEGHVESTPIQDDYKEEVAVSPVAAAPHQPPVDNAASKQPRSYATLLKAGGGGFSSPAPVTPVTARAAPLSPPIASVFPSARGNDSNATGTGARGGMGGPMRGGRGGSSARGMGGSRPGDRASSNFERNQPRLSVSEESGGNYTSPGPDADRNRRGQSGSSGGSPQYSDKQQLFMGSIPPNLSDDDIRGVFSKYGAISELRIKRNGPGKHFGFITFEEVTAAQAVLHDRPITLPDNPTVKLNIEEKKARTGGRGSDGPSDRSDRNDRSERGDRSDRNSTSSAGGRGDGGRPGRGDGGGPRGGIRGGLPHRGGRGGFMRGEGRPSGGPGRGSGGNTSSSFSRR